MPLVGKAQSFQPLDLSQVVNRGFTDVVAGDGEGGWTDQGPNDLRGIKPGRQNWLGVPVQIVDPRANAGKGALVLQSRNTPWGVERTSVPVNAKARTLFIAHTSAWADGGLARYIVTYADGGKDVLNVWSGIRTGDWWSPEDGGKYRTAYVTSNPERMAVAVFLTGWEHKHPDRTIAQLTFESLNGQGCLAIVAVTLSDGPPELVGSPVVHNAVMPREAVSQSVRTVVPAAGSEVVRAPWRVFSREVGKVAPTYREALQEGPQAAAERFLSRLEGERGNPAVVLMEYEALAQALQETGDGARMTKTVLTLAASDREVGPVMAAALMTELVGPHKYSSYYPAFRTSQLPEEVAELAGSLLHNGDPFVRALAEWTLALKVCNENDAVGRHWPPAEGSAPAWYTQWAAQDRGRWLEADYVRQLVQEGRFLDAGAILTSAKRSYERARALAGSIAQRSPVKATLVQQALQQIRGLFVQMETLSGQTEPGTLARMQQGYLALRRAGRQLVLLSPELEGVQGIALAERRNFLYQHNLANGSFEAARFPPGSDLVLRRSLDPAQQVESLLKGRLGWGVVRNAELHWDADRIVLAYNQVDPEPYVASDRSAVKVATGSLNLYELDLHTGALEQLTDDPISDDLEPTYLPGGDVVFGSDRGSISSQCGPYEQDAGVLNLFRLHRDSGEVRRLTYNKDYDRYAHVLNDGTVGFTRWDYQEKHFYLPHTFWVIRPDGTHSDLLYKAHMGDGPHSLRHAMPIPGSDKVIAIAAGHHAHEEGGLALVDHHRPDLNDPEGIRYITPYASPTEGGYGRTAKAVPQGGVRDAPFMGAGGYYTHPFPLSEFGLFCAAAYHKSYSNNFQVYYIDVWGHKELVHRDLHQESVLPMPLVARTRPPEPASQSIPDMEHALITIQDVYADLPGVRRGDAKYLRIFSRVSWPLDRTGNVGALRWFPEQGSSFTFGYWNWSPARIIGTVPVEPDGSAYFKAPAKMALSFQLLDGNKMEIRRMRAHVEFQPGEVRSCVGCHETKGETPVVDLTGGMGPAGTLTALSRPPSTPELAPWGDRVLLDFDRHVLPIFERHCTDCHGEVAPEGGLEFTARKDPLGFAQAYRTLFGVKWGEPIPDGRGTVPFYRKYYGEDSPVRQASRAEEQAMVGLGVEGQLVDISDRRGDDSISQPYEFGSHNSLLVKTLLEDPDHLNEVKLTPDEWEALVTWVDQNAYYNGRFQIRRDPATGRPLRPPVWVDVTYPDPWIADEYNQLGEPQLPATTVADGP